MGVLRPKLQAVDSASGIFDATASSGAAVTELTLEQHKEFLLLKMEIKKIRTGRAQIECSGWRWLGAGLRWLCWAFTCF